MIWSCLQNKYYFPFFLTNHLLDGNQSRFLPNLKYTTIEAIPASNTGMPKGNSGVVALATVIVMPCDAWDVPAELTAIAVSV